MRGNLNAGNLEEADIGLTAGPSARFAAARVWAWAGLLAQAVFVASWLVAASWQGPRYSVLAHTISDLYAVTAPNGTPLVVILTLCGAATMGFAWRSVWPALRTGGGWEGWARPTRWTAVLITAFAVASVLTQDAGYTGLFERLVAAAGAAGLAMLAIGILRRTLPRPDSSRR